MPVWRFELAEIDSESCAAEIGRSPGFARLTEGPRPSAHQVAQPFLGVNCIEQLAKAPADLRAARQCPIIWLMTELIHTKIGPVLLRRS